MTEPQRGSRRPGSPITALAFTATCVISFVPGCQQSPGTAEEPPKSGASAGQDSVREVGRDDDAIRADKQAALEVIRSYYAAITERRYREARGLWASSGAASGQTLEEFQSGFANTAAVEVDMGDAGQIGAAAGSRYLDVPVRIRARLRDGTRQEFQGTYTLRRSVVDGATAEQRAWRIYSAHIRAVQVPTGATR